MGTVGAHVGTCGFTLLPCPKQCKDSKAETNQYMRKDLEAHLEKHCPNRDYQCQYCGEDGTYANITYIHHKTCQKKMVPCSNADCQETMECGVVGAHVKGECGYTVIPCKYRSLGCSVERQRRDMPAHQHQDKQRHLDMAMDTVLELRWWASEISKKFSLPHCEHWFCQSHVVG